MNAFIKTFLALFGSKGLKSLINALVSTPMAKDLIKGLIMGRLAGLKEKYPTLYQTLDGYATAVASIADVTTDDNAADVEQIAALFALEAHLKGVELSLKTLENQSKAIRIKA